MPKASSLLVFFGLAPILAGFAPAALAGYKQVDMGYYDAPTIVRACQEARASVRSNGQYYGCGTRGVSILCNSATCIATANDLTPLSGDSLQAVIDAMRGRAGRQIGPLDARLKASIQ